MEIKIKKGWMTDNIPFEMQVEIMKRLPVKSLAVFRSVSKVWKSMIDSPLFITDYTNYHQHHRILIRYSVQTLRDFSFESEFKYVSMVDNDTLSQHEFETVSNVPVSFQLRNKLDLVGTSQGLLCLFSYSGYDTSFKPTSVIWNPSLGKSIVVDLPYVQKIYSTVIGFGVRPDNFDPMIVMVNMLHSKPVMVFTLSSRVWRLPRGNLPPKSIYFESMSTVAIDDRCIYWKAHGWSINLVIAFDMVSEDFTEINLPYSVAHRHKDDFSISKIKDSLTLLEYYDDAKKPVCHVWMMVEDGAPKSFTKLFTINTPNASFWIMLLGFRKNDQPIMETTTYENRESSIEAYEPSTETIKNLGINGEPGSFYMSSYTETLLLLDQLDEQFVRIQLQL